MSIQKQRWPLNDLCWLGLHGQAFILLEPNDYDTDQPELTHIQCVHTARVHVCINYMQNCAIDMQCKAM